MRYNHIEVIDMQKTATLNLRVDPDVKSSAEDVLSQLGLPMSTAIDLFLRQVARTRSIPFPIALASAPQRVDASMMSADQIRTVLADGVADVDRNGSVDAPSAFDRFRAEHGFSQV